MLRLYSFILLSLFLFISTTTAIFAGGPDNFEVSTDSNAAGVIAGFFDLRERESFIQVTNTDVDPAGLTVHVQIFNVGNNCNENNFFDTYTITDTHTYDLRNILTNNGNPSGVVLPDDAYGIISISAFNSVLGLDFDRRLIGNMRILDISGYEYRTNLQGIFTSFQAINPNLTFNYNTNGGVTLSDVIGIVLSVSPIVNGEVRAADIVDNNIVFDIDIYDLNETPFSCRDVVFSCVDQDNPRLEELLEFTGTSVASFEYGINDAIPHSRGGELLCPGNIIDNGIVRIFVEGINGQLFRGYVGLNNGNGRGSMDSFWIDNRFGVPDPRG